MSARNSARSASSSWAISSSMAALTGTTSAPSSSARARTVSRYGIVLEAVLEHVGHVHHRLEREQEQVANRRLVLVGQAQRPGRRALIEAGAQARQHFLLRDCVLIAGLGRAFRRGSALFRRSPDRPAPARYRWSRCRRSGRSCRCHVDDVGVLEAAHHVGDRVHLADVGQELVAQALALATRRPPGRRCRRTRPRSGWIFCGLTISASCVQARIGHRHDADVGLDRAERESWPRRCPPWSTR